MKNAFHFIFHFKALFVLEIFTFLYWLFGYVEKRLDKKAMINYKIYDVIQWATNNYNTHIAQYQLIEYNMINNFLENHTKNVLGKQVPKYSIKYQNWAYLWINSLKLYKIVFIVCLSNSGSPKTYQNNGADHLLPPYIKLFEKMKRDLELVSPPHFLHGFWRKISLPLYFINWANFIAWLTLLLEMLGSTCIMIVVPSVTS